MSVTASGRLAGAGSPGRAERKATAWLVRSLAILRVAQLAPGALILVTGSSAYQSRLWVLAIFVAEVAWSVLLFGAAVRLGWFTSPWMLGDAALQTLATVAVGRMCLPGQSTQTANWSVGLVIGALILASLFLGRVALAAVTAVLVTGYVAGVAADLPGQWANAVSNVVSIAAFTWAASLVGNRLIGESRAADAASDLAAREEQARARTEARYDERTRQYQRLHDTVLSTLEGIARGGLEYAEESVRRRCSSDANLVRSLNAAVDHVTHLAPLPVALADEMRAVEAFGLTIHQFTERVPSSVPPPVVSAAAGAVREALNNVVKHSGAAEAWVSTRGLAQGGIVIRVVDRGVGFDPARTPAGGGIAGSIRRRWSEVGGVVDVDSGAAGTMIELRWEP